MERREISICSWNVNGIASLCKSEDGLDKALKKAGGDIIAFQETKLTSLDWYSSISNNYYSYFSLCRPPRAYSGTATFVSKQFPVFKAQDGLTGQYSKSPADQILVISSSDVDMSEEEMLRLDAEGRCVMTDHGNFVLLNVYAPNAQLPDFDRYCFKLRYQYLLSVAVAALQAQGRAVIVLGDLNATIARLDHCEATLFDYISDGEGTEGGLEGRQHTFESRPATTWLRHLCSERESVCDGISASSSSDGPAPQLSSSACRDLWRHLAASSTDGSQLFSEDIVVGLLRKWTQLHCGLTDTFRVFHPERERAFTVWNTKTGARQTNYGTRLDYILISSSLVEYLTGSDISPHVDGSDHCPVHCSLALPPFTPPAYPAPPPLCTYWVPGFGTKQSTIRHFVSRKRPAAELTTTPTQEGQVESRPLSGPLATQRKWINQPSDSLSARKGGTRTEEVSVAIMESLFGARNKPPSKPTSGACGTVSRALPARHRPSVGPQVRGPTANRQRIHTQKTISFGSSHTPPATPPAPSSPYSSSVSSSDAYGNIHPTCDERSIDSNVSADLISGPDAMASAIACPSSSPQALLAFRALFAPSTVPRCKGHNEPCAVRVVSKEGPNCGKRFFCCAYPVGEKGNPSARCNFFQWDERSKPRARAREREISLVAHTVSISEPSAASREDSH